MKLKLQNAGIVGTTQTHPLCCSSRLMLAIVGLFGFFCLYMQRVGMSVAVVCMVNHTAMTEKAVVNETLDHCSGLHGKSPANQDGPFLWNKTAQGHVLGAFFYGYLVSQIPAGFMAELFGGKWVLAGFFFLSTVGTFLTPVAAKLGFGAMIVIRVIVGIGSGGMFPAMHTVLGHWSPPMERSKLAGITYAGMMLGNVIALPLAGLLCQFGFGQGWDSVFYVFGMISMVWLTVWVIFIGDNPSTCRFISKSEKMYIDNSLQGQVSSTKVKCKDMPWLAIVMSPAVWAIIIANFTSDWGLYTLLTNIPTYLREVLKFDIQSNGFISALPFLGMWINMNVSPIIADKLQLSGTLSTVHTRKLMNTIGQLGPAAFLIGMAFIDCSHTIAAVCMLVCGVTLLGSCYSGYMINHMDIAPHYAGILMGIANCIGATSGFIAPLIAASLTPNKQQAEWRRVFFIAAAVHVFGTILYSILASGHIQKWAIPSEMTNEQIEVKLEQREQSEPLNQTLDNKINIQSTE